MNRIAFILASIAILACSSCGGKQDPSPRDPVWEEATDTAASASSAVKKVTLSGKTVLVPFRRTENGLAEVQVSLNGTPFNMWWDTGASITSISSLEFIKLVKEGKVNEEDKIGIVNTSYADGSSGMEEVYCIKEIFIQGKNNEYLVLNDVAVSVSSNLGAPLLIGQNVISNLPKHKFNDEAEVIEFDK